jgi:hypothetical protein
MWNYLGAQWIVICVAALLASMVALRVLGRLVEKLRSKE